MGLGAILLGAIALPAQAFDHEGLARRALERHIIPGYQRLAAAAAVQTAALTAACNAPDLERLDAARTSFKDALTAWGRIEHVRFGPIAEQNRYDAMIFWPDPRGIARRQIARVLAQQDADALSPQVLAGKSVAIQGFSALDVVLFGSGSEDYRPAGDGRALSLRLCASTCREHRDDRPRDAGWLV